MVKVVIYGKNNCIFCTKAKRLLAEILDEVFVYEEPTIEEVEDLKERTNQRTFPFIFFGDTFIGGFSDLEYKYQRGLLDEIAEKQNIKLKSEQI